MVLILKNLVESAANETVRALSEKLSNRGVQAKIATFEEDVEFFLNGSSAKCAVDGMEIDQYAGIFIRKAGTFRNAAFALSRIAKKNNITCIDRQWQNFFAPGKFQQMINLSLAGVSIPKTYYACTYSDVHIKNAIDYLRLPIVVKYSVSKKGDGVFLAKKDKELKELLKNNVGKEMILQEFIENKFDYRVLVLGGNVAVAEKRTRVSKDEFRNNVFLGAEEEFLDVQTLPEKISKIAINAASTMDIQVAGVDVVVGENGAAYVFEVNRSPAFTLDEGMSNELEKLTDYIMVCNGKK